MPEHPAPLPAPVRLTRDGAVACITLARPKARNALDVATAEGLRAACEQVCRDPAVRAIVLLGEGPSFGVGGDLAALRHDPVATAARLIEPMHAAVRLLARCDAPVLAALQGSVAGGSLSLALAADLLLMADDARLNLAYAQVGASCDVGASWQLPRRVGLGAALEIALLSEPLDAQQALRLGLVNRVVPAAQLQQETLALARRLAAGPTRALGRMKRLMRQSFDRTLHEQLDAEQAAFAECAATEDFRAAADAFFNRQPATFHGR